MNTFLGFAFLILAFYGLVELIDAFERWTIKRSPVPKAIERLVLFGLIFAVSTNRPHWSDFIVGAVAWTILLQPQVHILRSIPRRFGTWRMLRKAKREIDRLAERDDMPQTWEEEQEWYRTHPILVPDSFTKMAHGFVTANEPTDPPEETTTP